MTDSIAVRNTKYFTACLQLNIHNLSNQIIWRDGNTWFRGGVREQLKNKKAHFHLPGLYIKNESIFKLVVYSYVFLIFRLKSYKSTISFKCGLNKTNDLVRKHKKN